MNFLKKKITFGLIIGTRGIFNPKLAQQGRKEILKKLEALGYASLILPENATPYGAIETPADAHKYAEFFKQKRDDIDGIIVILPNFGDEIAVAQTLAIAKLNVPVLVQACNDSLDAVDVNSRRDAFCGKLSVCNNLYQYGIPFTDTTEHTCDIDDEVFSRDIERFAGVCRVVKGLRNARVGAIGARPAAFQTMRFSEKLLQNSGITVVTVDLSEIISNAKQLDNKAKKVLQKISEIREYGCIPNHIQQEQILKQANLSVVIDNWMEDNQLNASAIQCWNSIQYNYGCATCLSMSLMGEKCMPSACEVDVTGAISMYALLLASGKIPGLLDWNNNYGYEKDKCVCTHCSNYPKSFMGNDIEISDLDILGNTLGREKCFGAIKGHVAKGPMTYFRISTDDIRGKIKTYLGEGQFVDEPFGMDGGIAVCKVHKLRNLMAYLCQEGFEHHVAMTRTHCASVLHEAVSKYLKWDIYWHDSKEQ
jgi:L-fucose isomerase-like protein